MLFFSLGIINQKKLQRTQSDLISPIFRVQIDEKKLRKF